MKSIFGYLLIVSSLIFCAGGCVQPRQNNIEQGSNPTVLPSETPDVASTVNAAVNATSVAKEAVEATINSSVAASLTANPSKPTPISTANAPKPTATIINPAYVTEEEVAALVEKEVEEALLASSICATTSTTATEDNSLTQDELQEIEAAIYASEEAISEANQIAEQYLAMYSEMGEETIALLQQMESDLSAMSQSTAQIAATLDEINSTMQQGQAIAEETISKLETQAEQIQSQVVVLQEKASGWKEKVNEEMNNRVNLAAGIQADQIVNEKAGALQQVNQYINLVKSSIADGKLSAAEITNVNRAGANASASLRQFGDSGISMADKINSVTISLTKGEMPQVMNGLSDMENNFKSLGTNLREKSSPSLPQIPNRR